MGDALLERIRLGFPDMGKRMEGQQASAAAEPLPFYRQHRLVTLEIASAPPQTFSFLDDGVKLHALQKPGDVGAANARERLQLVPQHAEAYARFAMRYSLGQTPIERPDQLRWYSDAHEKPDLRAKKDETVKALKPLRFVLTPEGGFQIVALLRQGRDLVEQTYRLTLDGNLEPAQKQVVVKDVPSSGALR